MVDYNFTCGREHDNIYININCVNDEDRMSKCNVSIVDMTCSDQNDKTWSNITPDKPTFIHQQSVSVLLLVRILLLKQHQLSQMMDIAQVILQTQLL